MATCQGCAKKGWLLSLTKDTHLCRECNQLFQYLEGELVRAINGAIDLVRVGRSPGTKQEQCDLILEKATRLADLYRRYHPTLAPAAEKLYQEYQRIKLSLQLNDVREQTTALMEQARQAPQLSAKIAHAQNALALLRRSLARFPNQPLLADSARAVETYIRELRFNQHCALALEGELAGNLKRAIEHYRAALNLLRSANIFGEAQSTRLCEITRKLDELAFAWMEERARHMLPAQATVTSPGREIKVYLSDPVLLSGQDVQALKALEQACRRYGLVPVNLPPRASPARNLDGLTHGHLKQLQQLLQECQVVVANCNQAPDTRYLLLTAWEVGFAWALGKVIFGFGEEWADLGLGGPSTIAVLQGTIDESGGSIVRSLEEALEQVAHHPWSWQGG